MINTKAFVELQKTPSSGGYKMTIMMGISADTQPADGEIVLLESLDDLYKYFNSFDKSESYKTAEACLLKGFKIVAYGTSALEGPATCAKYATSSGYEFRYPSVNLTFDYGDVQFYSESSTFSYILTFKLDSSYNNYRINDDNLMIVSRMQKYIGEISTSEEVYQYALIGLNYADLHLTGYDGDDSSTRVLTATSSNTVQTATTYAPSLLAPSTQVEGYNISVSNNGFISSIGCQPTYKQYKQFVLEFLSEFCGFTVNQIGDTNSYYIQCPTDTPQMVSYGATVAIDGEEVSVLSIEPIWCGKDNVYCYGKTPICLLKTKTDSSIQDTSVEITKSFDQYYVNVYKTTKQGVPVISESFRYDVDPTLRNITNLTTDSELVDFVADDLYDSHNSILDFSGTYDLRGRYREDLVDDTLPLDTGADFTELAVDIVFDSSRNATLSVDYFKKLLESFPTSLILTDSGYGVGVDNTLVINPDIIWVNKDSQKFKGATLLLDLLPIQDSGAFTDQIQLQKTSTTVGTLITKSEYGVRLLSNVTWKSRTFPVKSLLSLYAIENQIKTNTYMSETDFRTKFNNIISTINKYYETDTQASITFLNKSGSRLSVEMVVRIDTYVISSFKINVTVLY